MTKLFHLGQYVRHDRNVWVSPCGVRITDPAMLKTLEAEYRAAMREHNGHRPERGRLPAQIRADRQRGVVTGREPKHSGRVNE